ncbi:hypothetical protein M409DRAFT_62443 [Zasmidium cellare ATCC 36951]|uniref:Aconitase X catalytic domain-containing protein n=1 Tax=Zasmidium cellare ATCC 36951 TaxID=1080233 RepID=A0A6A6D018_ZASCE|nr:uncharacterized protein M409DRAFT_62443 [Zasmidium cellare ATCC 36951]KAF2172721.1 hypothetical protein M409DRAFT_62443 [Zasmidium cellare ATCC 36951]
MPHFRGKALINGEATGPLLFSNVPLSFWGGTDPSTGEIIDRHHPLSGRILHNHILAIPAGRGSCTGSMAMLELMLAGTAPLGLIFEVPEQIITLGVIVARKMFDRSIPVVVLSSSDFALLGDYEHVAIAGENVHTGPGTPPEQIELQLPKPTVNKLQLTEDEEVLLAKGPKNAKGLAMEILTGFAALQGATSLVSVSQAHIDACVYTGPASLSFAESLLSLPDAQVAVPTSMNSISIDQRRWREIGMEPEKAEAANRLGNAYVKMGARPTFTCAPYLLDSSPERGQHIGWGESNAVVFANSVLGARTQKYPDCIDVCIALTGKAPSSGCHNSEDRAPRVLLKVSRTPVQDESIFPLLGYRVGLLSGADIPVVIGMEDMKLSLSDLKAFGAAFATTSSAAMFHIRGITPEALSLDKDYSSLQRTQILTQDLVRCWQSLNTAQDDSVSMIALGNPHFSLEEFYSLAQLCEKYDRPTEIPLIITTSRAIHEKFIKFGRGQILEKIGAQVISDTCWCMLEEPVVPPGGGNIMTNSAKYAHYAPGLVRRMVHFDSLEACVRAAFEGRHSIASPSWLRSS